MKKLVTCKSGYMVTKTKQNITIVILFLLGLGMISAGLPLVLLMMCVVMSTSDMAPMWRLVCVPVALIGMASCLGSHGLFTAAMEEYKSAYEQK